MEQTDPVEVVSVKGDSSILLNQCRSPTFHKHLWTSCTESLDGPMDNQYCIDNCTYTTEDILCEIPAAIRHELVEYLQLGDTELLHITENNFHCYFHLATQLKHASLFKVCCTFFIESRQQNTIENDIRHCKCYNSLVNSLCRLQCDPECTCPKTDTIQSATKYAILFPWRNDSSDKNTALVTNLNEFNVVTRQTPHKMQHIGHGFALCAIYKRECPYVVVSGGEGKHTTTLDRYDVILNKWLSPSRLQCARVNHLMVPVSDCIYIIGGNNCSSIERLRPSDNKTVELDSKLLVEVRSASSAVWKEKVFIFGGKSQRGHVSCVQCFDTRTNKVTRLSDLPCQCSGGQAVVVGDMVFIATHQGHMIMFNPRTGHSELRSHQPIRRKHFFMCVKSGEIYITDGVRTDSIQTVELPICKYNPDKDLWVKIPSARKQLAIQTSCVIELKKRCPVVPFMDMYLY